MECENCKGSNEGTYGSGRFCSPKCARGFSSKEKRSEINEKVSKSLLGRKVGGSFKKGYDPNRYKHQCPVCKRWFRTDAAFGGHCVHCPGDKVTPALTSEGREKRAWSKGLTKETDERIANQALQITVYPDDLVFAQGTPQYTDIAKQRYRERTPEICEMCGVDPEWNGKFLRLQIHHKNGSSSDNRWDNLQKVCPNCHSQTETWGRKTRNAPRR